MWFRKVHLKRSETIAAHVGSNISVYLLRGPDGDYRVGIKAPEHVEIVFESVPRPLPVAD